MSARPRSSDGDTSRGRRRETASLCGRVGWAVDLTGHRKRRHARAITGLVPMLTAAMALLHAGGTSALAATAPRAAPPDRYSLAGGCYTLRSHAVGRLVAQAPGGYAASAAHASEAYPIHMQATALGSYLLYGPDRAFVSAGPGGAVTAAGDPSESGVWQAHPAGPGAFTLTSGDRALGVEPGSGRLVLVPAVGAGPAAEFQFLPASHCAAYPEAEVNARGTPSAGPSPQAEVKGTIDAHTHVTAFEFIGGDFHCGRPWHPFGAPAALPDCASIQGPQGSAAPVQNFLDYGQPVRPHDTKGWDTFRDWPGFDKLTYENTYYTGLKRAWMAGLRIMVTDLVDNEALCTVMPMKRNPCNDMDSVRLQARDLRELQDYIDAQSGGPGKGWFRIVTDPFHARQVVNQGKLAVVEGVEVSRVFGCGEQQGTPQCDRDQVDRGLAEFKALGVSSFYPVHKFDNAFGGTKMDGGAVGAIVNAGNHLETGQFWDVKTCQGHAQDSQQLTAPDPTVSSLLAGPLNGLLPSGTLPAYPPPPHCNQRGLTDLGQYVLRRMMEKHYIVEVDHMDVRTADQALSLMEARHYSGVISPHSWTSPEQYGRIYHSGGFVNPIAGSSPQSFVAEWRADKRLANPKYYFGFGYGSDSNGLAEQSTPTSGRPITYPFRSFDGGVTFDRERWGQRVFDINQDGVANYGMYADWLEELRLLGGQSMMTDMNRGAESYLQMWERAYGVPATHCRPAREGLTYGGVGPIRLGEPARALLFGAGQPAARPAHAYRYCVDDGGGQAKAAVFDTGQHVAFVGTSSRGDRAGAISPGSSARSLPRVAKRLASDLWLSRASQGGVRYVYGVGGGKVRYIAVAGGDTARSASQLRADAHAAGLA